MIIQKNCNKRRGSIASMFIVLGVWLIILILFITAVMYAQINLVVYNIKSDLFYIVQNSLDVQTEENLAYSEYLFDEEAIKDHIEKILNINYIGEKSTLKKGIKSIHVEETKSLKVGEKLDDCEKLNTKNRLHIKIKIVYEPVINIMGDEKEIILHDDIKMELLKIR